VGIDADVAMADDDDEEVITWEEYDFTKPTGRDRSTCADERLMASGAASWSSCEETRWKDDNIGQNRRTTAKSLAK
jgi:hypothetical protein